MYKWLIFLFVVNVMYPAISMSSVKDNYNFIGCVENAVVNTMCKTPSGDPGTCIHRQDCITNTNIDKTRIRSIDKRRHYPAKLTPTTDPLVCCIASKHGKAAGTLPLNDTKMPKINRVKRSSATECGWRNPNSLSGNPTPKGEAIYGELPWMVNILEVTGSKDNGVTFDFKYIGGGAFIRKRVVLTAAHVVHNVPSSKVYVAVGDHDQLVKDEKNKKILKVLDIISHDKFIPGAYTYDITVLLLNDVQTLPNIKSICLPTPSMEPRTDTVCFQSGWAKNKTKIRYHILSKVEMSIVDRHTCQNHLRTSDLGPYFELSDTFICAIGQQGVDTCKVSGGSPFVCSMKGQQDRFEIWGIVSATLHCGDDGYPDLFTHVSYLQQWIQERLQDLGLLESK